MIPEIDSNEILKEDDIAWINIYPIKKNFYRITKSGLIINSKNEIAQYFISNTGYYRINLVTVFGTTANFSVHRLVALTFIPNPYNLPIVNHIDGNKLKNHTSNLEWASYKYNWEHAKNVLHMVRTVGTDCHLHKSDKYSIELVKSICDLLEEYPYKSNEIIAILELQDPIDNQSHDYRCLKKFIKNIRQRRCWKDISKDYVWASERV